MSRIRVSKRDSILVIIGVLLSIFFQVTYEVLNELINNNISLKWTGTQVILMIVVGIILIWIIVSKVEEK